MKLKNPLLCLFAGVMVLTSCDMQKWKESGCDGYRLITQKDGATLGYSPESGVKIIYDDGYAFKDLDGDGKLDVYEDWREPAEKRAADLAEKLSIEEIAGLMLYSNHQAVPATSYDISLYDGKPYSDGHAKPWEITDHQKQFLRDDHLRHILVTIIESPKGGWGYSMDDVKNGGNGYLPISLQYNDYTATTARQTSIAGGDPYENFTNRSYRGKSTSTANRCDMELVVNTKKAMGVRPVIVSVKISNPFVMKEIEPYADALFVTFDVQNQVILDLATGRYEPSGLLPFQMPADMETVEAQAEDTPRDMRCHVDSDNNIYDFGFGMNWKGKIEDERTVRYK